MEWFLSALPPFVGAFSGTLWGLWFFHWQLNRQIQKVREELDS